MRRPSRPRSWRACASATRSRSPRTGRERWPTPARASACPFHHVRHLVRDPHPFHDVAAIRELRALARGIAPDVVQINSSKAGVLARLALAGLGSPYRLHRAWLGVLGARRRRGGRVHGQRASGCAPHRCDRVRLEPRPAARARARHRAARRPARDPQRRRRARRAAGAPRARQPPRARLHGATRTAEGPDHAARRARPAGLRDLGAARLRRRPRPRRDRAASRCARPGRSRDAARPSHRCPGAARRLRRVRADHRLGGPAVLDSRGHGRRTSGARDARRRHRGSRGARLDRRARARRAMPSRPPECSQPGPPIRRPC